MKKVLVTGANGQLGSEIRYIANQFVNLQFIFTDIEELDVANPQMVKEFMTLHLPDFLVNCVAYTAVDKAETEVEKATLINAEAIKIMARESANIGCKMIHTSTDYVFDGTGNKPYKEDDPVNPKSVYGKTKLKGEEYCLEYNSDSIIIRTSWLYSSYGQNFVKTMLRLADEKKEISVVSDQIGCPTNAADLACAILDIISGIDQGNKTFIPGIYHYSNEGFTSWFEFAQAIFKHSHQTCIVKPISTADYPSSTPRPKYSVMDKSKIKLNFDLTIPQWEESLIRYFQNKK